MGEQLSEPLVVQRGTRFTWRPGEPFSCFSHFAGVPLGIAGLVALIVLSAGDPWRIVSFSIYGATLVLLYLASTVYHWLHLSAEKRVLLNRLDHTAIFLLIAGTYTPICLVTLRGPWGWSVFGVVWGVALAGTVIKLFFPELPRWISTALYLGMGWIAVVAATPLVRAFSTPALLWLVAGGLLYSAGAIIYGTRRPDPFPEAFGFHEIFHLFVLGGSLAHFVFMVRYVAPV